MTILKGINGASGLALIKSNMIAMGAQCWYLMNVSIYLKKENQDPRGATSPLLLFLSSPHALSVLSAVIVRCNRRRNYGNKSLCLLCTSGGVPDWGEKGWGARPYIWAPLLFQERTQSNLAQLTLSHTCPTGCKKSVSAKKVCKIKFIIYKRQKSTNVLLLLEKDRVTGSMAIYIQEQNPQLMSFTCNCYYLCRSLAHYNL